MSETNDLPPKFNKPGKRPRSMSTRLDPALESLVTSEEFMRKDAIERRYDMCRLRGLSQKRAAAEAGITARKMKDFERDPLLQHGLSLMSLRDIEQVKTTRDTILRRHLSTMMQRVASLEAIAFADITAAFIQDDDGRCRFKKFYEMPHSLRRAIQDIKVDDAGHVKSLKLEPKLTALKLLMEFYGDQPVGEATVEESKSMSVDELRTLSKNLELVELARKQGREEGTTVINMPTNGHH